MFVPRRNIVVVGPMQCVRHYFGSEDYLALAASISKAIECKFLHIFVLFFVILRNRL